MGNREVSVPATLKELFEYLGQPAESVALEKVTFLGNVLAMMVGYLVSQEDFVAARQVLDAHQAVVAGQLVNLTALEELNGRIDLQNFFSSVVSTALQLQSESADWPEVQERDRRIQQFLNKYLVINLDNRERQPVIEKRLLAHFWNGTATLTSKLTILNDVSRAFEISSCKVESYYNPRLERTQVAADQRRTFVTIEQAMLILVGVCQMHPTWKANTTDDWPDEPDLKLIFS